MANKTQWKVLACKEGIEEIGIYPTKKRALAVIEKEILNYEEFGMALVKFVEIGKNMPITVDAWNYVLENGEIYYRRNHHDLW